MKKENLQHKEQETFTIHQAPERVDPEGGGWSVDIILVVGTRERMGYFDPQGSTAGGKFFYYTKKSIRDCALLKKFPTHWRYA